MGVTELNLDLTAGLCAVYITELVSTFRYQRWFEFAAPEPVEERLASGFAVAEESSVSNLLPTTKARTEPLFRLSLQKPLDEGPRRAVHHSHRETQRCLQHLCVDSGHVVQPISEGIPSTYELVHNDPERPDVHLCAVATALENLWCDVVRCTNGRERPPTFQPLGCAKVNKLWVALLVEHDILRLQVTVHDATGMESLQRYREATSIEARLISKQGPAELPKG
mmetsp:Transcript_106143/g.342359  ORF Transcript_106143/g.342359 Transcript_106143/m.342359 type:complete len:224 (-) Transcript_106143:2457-3128(-)